MSRKIYAQTALTIRATLAETGPQTRAPVAVLIPKDVKGNCTMHHYCHRCPSDGIHNCCNTFGARAR